MSDNLVLEILKQMQGEMGAIRNELRALKTEMRDGFSSLSHATLRIDQEILLLRGDNQAIKDRLDRIERRLELVE